MCDWNNEVTSWSREREFCLPLCPFNLTWKCLRKEQRPLGKGWKTDAWQPQFKLYYNDSAAMKKFCVHNVKHIINQQLEVTEETVQQLTFLFQWKASLEYSKLLCSLKTLKGPSKINILNQMLKEGLHQLGFTSPIYLFSTNTVYYCDLRLQDEDANV